MSEADAITKEEAVKSLSDARGQGYRRAREATFLLFAFAEDVAPEFVAENWPYDHTSAYDQPHDEAAVNVLQDVMADRQDLARDARGTVFAHRNVPVITNADLSALLVEALGGEPSDAVMGGHGYTADVRHRENLDVLDDLLDLPVEPR